jgi:hypothetical protein
MGAGLSTDFFYWFPTITITGSPLYAKGDPIFRVLRVKRWPSDFGIVSSENTPTEILRRSKNNLEKKKGHKHHPKKKARALPFALAR